MQQEPGKNSFRERESLQPKSCKAIEYLALMDLVDRASCGGHSPATQFGLLVFQDVFLILFFRMFSVSGYWHFLPK